jgi:hypothetical protein
MILVADPHLLLDCHCGAFGLPEFIQQRTRMLQGSFVFRVI